MLVNIRNKIIFIYIADSEYLPVIERIKQKQNNRFNERLFRKRSFNEL